MKSESTETLYAPLSADQAGAESLAAAAFGRAQALHRTWRRRFFVLLFVSLTIIPTLVGLAVHKWTVTQSCSSQPGARDSSGRERPYSPAPVRYVHKWLGKDPEMHKYVGNPRKELDEAWHELLEGTLIRYSEEELKLAGNVTSVKHKDGGYLGGLGVSHSLHCLKRIKQYLYKDYYFPDHDKVDWAEIWMHVDHCLESLRQEVLCNADTSVYALEWTPHSSLRPSVRVPQAHVCVDWNHLHEWMKGRAATNDDMVRPPDSMFAEAKKLKEEKKKMKGEGHEAMGNGGMPWS